MFLYWDTWKAQARATIAYRTSITDSSASINVSVKSAHKRKINTSKAMNEGIENTFVFVLITRSLLGEVEDEDEEDKSINCVDNRLRRRVLESVGSNVFESVGSTIDVSLLFCLIFSWNLSSIDEIEDIEDISSPRP